MDVDSGPDGTRAEITLPVTQVAKLADGNE
jgi:hypothetical protein